MSLKAAICNIKLSENTDNRSSQDVGEQAPWPEEKRQTDIREISGPVKKGGDGEKIE